MRADFAAGELFLGQPFGGLESGQTPQFLSDVELFFILADLQWNSPWLVKMMEWVPLASIRHLLGAMQRLGDVSAHIFSTAWEVLLLTFSIVW